MKNPRCRQKRSKKQMQMKSGDLAKTQQPIALWSIVIFQQKYLKKEPRMEHCVSGLSIAIHLLNRTCPKVEARKSKTNGLSITVH